MTVAVDFDGVIHAYTKGWQNGEIYDPPMPGAFEALDQLMATHPVFIHTSRTPEQVAQWLIDNAPDDMALSVTYEAAADREFWNERGILLVTSRKLPAQVYIDDRGLHFRNWEQTLLELGRRGI
ncbi:hypothetical protein ACIP4X_17790 [Streptomyces sp. NPDC088817]|uniref:hypothetical protein n=1 Tax=unclassified Streptomyces TaxID=2593676 RepID=UPI002DD87D2A|nr:hypothetical protein [Streptomyces sp. NBC_01788]WSB29685.1 hypothetical protein OIE49_29475 [Streptomyces sp. NBC_01788]